MVIQSHLVLARKSLDFTCRTVDHISVNYVASFKPAGYLDDPKGAVLTALYYINVRLTYLLWAHLTVNEAI